MPLVQLVQQALPGQLELQEPQVQPEPLELLEQPGFPQLAQLAWPVQPGPVALALVHHLPAAVAEASRCSPRPSRYLPE